MQEGPAGVAKPWVPEVEDKRIAIEYGLYYLDCNASSCQNHVCLFNAVVSFVGTLFGCQVSVRVEHYHRIGSCHVNYLYLQIGRSLNLPNLNQPALLSVNFRNGQSNTSVRFKWLLANIWDSNVERSNQLFFKVFSQPSVCRQVYYIYSKCEEVICNWYIEVLREIQFLVHNFFRFHYPRL